MNFIVLILVLLIRIIEINQTRGEQNIKTNELKTAYPRITKAQQADILREELRESLEHKLPDVTSKTHDEVKQLNTQITSAVLQNAYSNKNFRPPDENILKRKEHHNMPESPHALRLAAPPSNTSSMKTDEITITHNIIESNIISDFVNQTTNSTIWHPSLISKTHLNRELLKLNYIKQNFNYNFDNFTHIKLWKLIKINLTANLLIGLCHNHENNGSQLILITEIGFNFTFAKMIAFPKRINKLEIVRIALNQYLVTIENNTFINFYKIVTSNKTYELERINEINLHKQILHLKFFYKRVDKIRLIFVTEFDGQISADLYEFEFENVFNFWLIKTNPLSSMCHNIAILDTGRDYIVAFAQMNEVVVYQYENDIFKQLDTIKTDMVTDVSGFSMGGYSYLAVGGHKPQIMRYHRGQLVPQSMLSQSFGLVVQWFPISARTHRDDLLLLVQHRIKFTTHSLNVLQALIWDGEAFNIVPTTPCYHNGTMSSYGITCMIDIEQETDIAGSVIIQHGKNISILVPRGQEPSQLFDLNIELVPVPNPLQQDINEFNSIYKILSTLVENFNSSIEQIQNTIDTAINPDEYTVIPGNWEIETLEFENTFVNKDIKIGTTTVGEIPVSKQESEFYLPFIEDILDEALKKFDEQNARTKRQENIPENNIQFEFLNGIPADELLFATEDTIELNGVQEFESSVYVGNDVILRDNSKINGISIRDDTINSESEVVLPVVECDEVEILENLLVMTDINGKEFTRENMGRLLDDGTRNTIIVEDMIVGGDLNITRINNVDFDHFLNKIIFKNLPSRLEKLSIDGNIFAETEFGLRTLNEMPYPDGFVFRKSTSQEDIIQGHKVFTQSLVTNEIDTDGEINGIKPSDVLTLRDEQFIPGEITFSQIEVTESLEVNGTIKGPNLDTFLANPTITQTNVINSSCIFNELEIEGNVYLIEIENINLDRILANIVYTDHPEDFITVNALKIFDIIYVETDHFTVSSNFVNNKYSLDNYVTKSDSQILNMNYINGSVKLNTVTLTGLFNGINATELDLNSIKTGGDQYIDKRVKFQHPIGAKDLKILGKINKKSINLLIDTRAGGNIRINSNFEIANLEIVHLNTNGNIQSESGELNAINLNEFDKVRFSLSRPQTIPGIFLVTSATVDGDLNPNFLNNVSMESFNALIENKKNTVTDIFSGKVPIDNITIKGNATINNVNGFNMDKIIQNIIWLDRPNTISNRLTFLDKVMIYSDLEVLSQVNTKYNLDTIFDHLVYHDQPIIVNEKKIFTNGIKIYGDYVTEYVNDVALRNLLLSNKLNHVKNKVIINGNLQINNFNAPYINDLELSELNSLYHFEEETKTHYLNIDNVKFVNPQEALRLYINGSINDLFNADELLKNIVQLNKPIHLDGNLKLFQNNLMFTKNLVVEKLNSIDLENYFDHLVHIDERDPVILNGNIEFNEDINVDEIRVGGDLITNTILSYDPNQWLRNRFFINENVYVQEPLKFLRGTFHGTAMGVQFLNRIDMSKVLTYNTEQVFNDVFHVSELVSFVPIQVSGLVNNISLAAEVKNTMMLTGNTTIKSPLHIKNLSVYKTIKPPHLINGKSLTDLIKIEPHMILPYSIYFNEIQTQSIITEHNNISGIDFQLWYTQSLWKRGRETQTVMSKYTISNIAVGEGGIHGTGLVNNKSINEIVEIRNRDHLKLVNEVLAYRKEIEFICMNLRHLIYLSKQQIYYVKYFDDRIILDNANSKIATKLFFVLNLEMYLLISSADCTTTIYKWDAKYTDFQKVLNFQSGYVSEWGQIHGRSYNETILLSHSIANGLKCIKTGVYMWRFNGYSIIENTNPMLIHPEYEIKSLWTSDKLVNSFFIITEGNNREPNVFQIDENFKIENQWKLPINHRKLQFLPTELINHLALSDGSQLFLINDYETHSSRVKRENWDKLRELFKRRHDILLGSADNRTLKIGLKTEKNVKQGLFDMGDKNSLVSGPQTTTITPNTTTTSESTNIVSETQTKPASSMPIDETPSTSKSINDTVEQTMDNTSKTIESVNIVSENQTTSASSVPTVETPSTSKAINDTVERIIDNIFEKIVKISDKSLKSSEGNKLGSQDVAETLENFVENISNNIVATTLTSLSKIEEMKFQVVKENQVGSSLGIDKENLTQTIDVGYPHVKNITKNFVVTTANAATNIQKLGEFVSNSTKTTEDEILSSEAVATLYDGYKSVEEVTKHLIDSTVYTVSQANELANKFEFNNDKQDFGVSNIDTRDVHDNAPNIVSNTTGNNSMVGTPLNTAYTEIEKIAKNLTDSNIKNIADMEDLKEKNNRSDTISSPPTIGSADEIVIANNSELNNDKHDSGVSNIAARDFHDYAPNIVSNATGNSSMVGTPLNTAYTEIEKIAKNLVDSNIKNIAAMEDLKERINQDTISSSPTIGSAPDEILIANNSELNNDNHDSGVSIIATRDIHDYAPNIGSNATGNSSMVGIPLNTAYTEIEKLAKNLVDSNIKNIAAMEDLKERINHLDTISSSPTIGSAPDEFVIANKSELNNDKHDSGVSNIATRHIYDYEPNIGGNATGKNSMVGTPLDTAYTEIEKIAKNLVDSNIKNIANIEDLKETINHSDAFSRPPKINNVLDEFVIAPNPTYTTNMPAAPNPNKQSQYNLGASIFNSFRRSRIGDKETKISPLQIKGNTENVDRTIGQEITYKGVIASENHHIPEMGTGEIVILYVGGKENRRMLTAVTTTTNGSTIPGKHDTIKIFDDILEGKIYQEIHASKPTGLTVLHIGDQTILAFLEDKVVIQLFIYHGIEGFKNFNEYKLPMIASHLSSIKLSRYGYFACFRHFLVVTFTNKLWFLEAIMEGNCGVEADLDCTLPLRSINNL